MRLVQRLRVSPSMVVACIALVIALGGTSYAAAVLRLPKDSVTTYQVKDFSLLARDFKRGQIPRGPAGPTGPVGPAGPAGAAGPTGPAGSVAMKWAVVKPDGTIVAQSGGITLAKLLAGQYILNFGSSVAGKLIIASGAYASDASDQRGETSAGPCGGSSDGLNCVVPYNNSNSVFVETRDNGGSPADHAFYVAVLG